MLLGRWLGLGSDEMMMPKKMHQSEKQKGLLLTVTEILTVVMTLTVSNETRSVAMFGVLCGEGFLTIHAFLQFCAYLQRY